MVYFPVASVGGDMSRKMRWAKSGLLGALAVFGFIQAFAQETARPPDYDTSVRCGGLMAALSEVRPHSGTLSSHTALFLIWAEYIAEQTDRDIGLAKDEIQSVKADTLSFADRSANGAQLLQTYQQEIDFCDTVARNAGPTPNMRVVAKADAHRIQVDRKDWFREHPLDFMPEALDYLMAINCSALYRAGIDILSPSPSDYRRRQSEDEVFLIWARELAQRQGAPVDAADADVAALYDVLVEGAGSPGERRTYFKRMGNYRAPLDVCESIYNVGASGFLISPGG